MSERAAEMSMTGRSSPGRDRIRVVRIITRLNIGGPALHVTLLTERLDPRRYESMLIAGTEEGQEGNYLDLHGHALPAGLMHVPLLGREVRGFQDAVAFHQIVRALRRLRPDIVHTHTAKAGMLGRLAAWWCRVPVVVHTYHGHVLRGYFNRRTTALFAGIERWLGRRSHRLLAVSHRVRRELLDLGIGRPDQFDVVPLGLDLGPFLRADHLRGQFRAEIGVAEHQVLIGIVARLVPIKAHEVFLASAVALVRQLPHSYFVVVGNGERRRDLEAMATAMGLGAHVRFVGWRRDLDRVYADLDVVVLTSRNEGLPVSLIEAMAAARPIVATDVGGVSELVESGVSGTLVPVDDAKGVARAIETIIMAPERGRAMGAAGRKRVYPAFDARRLLADIDQVYRDVMIRRGIASFTERKSNGFPGSPPGP